MILELEEGKSIGYTDREIKNINAMDPFTKKLQDIESDRKLLAHEYKKLGYNENEIKRAIEFIEKEEGNDPDNIFT